MTDCAEPGGNLFIIIIATISQHHGITHMKCNMRQHAGCQGGNGAAGLCSEPGAIVSEGFNNHAGNAAPPYNTTGKSIPSEPCEIRGHFTTYIPAPLHLRELLIKMICGIHPCTVELETLYLHYLITYQQSLLLLGKSAGACQTTAIFHRQNPSYTSFSHFLYNPNQLSLHSGVSQQHKSLSCKAAAGGQCC